VRLLLVASATRRRRRPSQGHRSVKSGGSRVDRERRENYPQLGNKLWITSPTEGTSGAACFAVLRGRTMDAALVGSRQRRFPVDRAWVSRREVSERNGSGKARSPAPRHARKGSAAERGRGGAPRRKPRRVFVARSHHKWLRAAPDLRNSASSCPASETGLRLRTRSGWRCPCSVRRVGSAERASARGLGLPRQDSGFRRSRGRARRLCRLQKSSEGRRVQGRKAAGLACRARAERPVLSERRGAGSRFAVAKATSHAGSESVAGSS